MSALWQMILKQSEESLYSILCSIGSQWRESGSSENKYGGIILNANEWRERIWRFLK